MFTKGQVKKILIFRRFGLWRELLNEYESWVSNMCCVEKVILTCCVDPFIRKRMLMFTDVIHLQHHDVQL